MLFYRGVKSLSRNRVSVSGYGGQKEGIKSDHTQPSSNAGISIFNLKHIITVEFLCFPNKHVPKDMI
jgi:hypothetical protein